MRRDCQPHFVDADGNLVSLHRVDFGNRALGEDFLQQQLHRRPSILPVEEIDDSFAPLVSLGREIGSMDNLFYLTYRTDHRRGNWSRTEPM